jgi:hypothetical protein
VLGELRRSASVTHLHASGETTRNDNQLRRTRACTRKQREIDAGKRNKRHETTRIDNWSERSGTCHAKRHRRARWPEPILPVGASCRAVEFFWRLAKFRRARTAARQMASLVLYDPPSVAGTRAAGEESAMKIIHGSLSALLSEVKERGKGDSVRIAALMQSTVEGAGIPRYTSWVIVSAQVDWEQWAEWRLVVGRQRAEVTEHGFRVPGKLAALTEEKLAEVCGWIEATGLAMRAGILAGEAETLEGVLG